MTNYEYFPKNIPIFPIAHLPNVSFLAQTLNDCDFLSYIMYWDHLSNLLYFIGVTRPAKGFFFLKDLEILYSKVKR